MVSFDEDEWPLSMDAVVGVLTHRDLEGCQIRSTAGHGLGPDWTALNSLVSVGGVEFEAIEIRHLNEFEFITFYTGAESNYYTGFQVGVEDISQECLDRAFAVLSTLGIINP